MPRCPSGSGGRQTSRTTTQLTELSTSATFLLAGQRVSKLHNGQIHKYTNTLATLSLAWLLVKKASQIGGKVCCHERKAFSGKDAGAGIPDILLPGVGNRKSEDKTQDIS